MVSLYIGLVHYPIKNKNGDLVTTSVTNLDIHDISRSSRTFGFKNYFIVTPLERQKNLVDKILGHWEEEKSSDYNPDRSDALSSTYTKASIEDCIKEIREKEGQDPLVVVTGANFSEFSGSVASLANQIKIDKKPCLLLFGTGWGLHQSALDKADFMLEPIYGSKDDYNHLSVRSAVAIYLSELCKELGI